MAVTGLKLVTIDYNEVEQALANPAQREFNTSFHSAEEAPGLNKPSEDAYSFKRWLGLILSTRGIALHTVEEVILRLVTSQRARNALFHSLEGGHTSFDLFFMPFDGRMRSDLEYRVFCPPGASKITGISQYQWHKPWRFAERDSQVQSIVTHTILDEATRIHHLIMEDLNSNNPMDKLLVDQGFSFDVFFDEDSKTCQLVELNGFGVRSSCGSCLFQWVKDLDQLYGVSNDVEFRVTT